MTATTPETTVETLPYKNPDLPASERIADLLSRMTLEEKVGQMMQLDARGGDLDELIVNKHVGSILHTSPEDLPRAVETVNTKTRLGIPLVIGELGPEGRRSGRPCHRRRSLLDRRALDVLPGAVHRARHPLGSRGRDLRRGPHAHR